jgi:hypothetical protein
MATGTLALVVLRGRRRPDTAAPVCGKCGYDVRGLPGNVCPECGSDLNVVGIRRPGDREPLAAGWRLAAWTVFVFLTVFVPLGVLWSEAQRRWLMVYDVTRNESFEAPRSGAYRRIRFEYRARSYGGNTLPRSEPAPERLTLTLGLNDGTVRTMDVTATGAPGSRFGYRYRYRDSAGRAIERASGPGEDALASWIAEAGVPAADPAVRRELADVSWHVRHAVERAADSGNTTVSSDAPFSGRGAGGSSNLYPARWSGYVPLAAALAVWVGGITFMLRRSGRESVPHP